MSSKSFNLPRLWVYEIGWRYLGKFKVGFLTGSTNKNKRHALLCTDGLALDSDGDGSKFSQVI